MTRILAQSTAYTAMVLMVDSTDHVSGKTGLTLTITASKAGGAFASISPTVTERGSGFYAVALTTSHTDTAGDLALHITATGADPADWAAQVLPGALITSGTGANQLRVSSGKVVLADNVTHGGANAEMSLKVMQIVNMDGTALTIASGASAGDALQLQAGNGGASVRMVSNFTGNGLGDQPGLAVGTIDSNVVTWLDEEPDELEAGKVPATGTGGSTESSVSVEGNSYSGTDA